MAINPKQVEIDWIHIYIYIYMYKCMLHNISCVLIKTHVEAHEMLDFNSHLNINIGDKDYIYNRHA